MKKIREYPIPRIYSDEAYDCYCQTALYKPTADELALLKNILEESDEDIRNYRATYYSKWDEFDSYCADLTGCYDFSSGPGARYERYAFRLTPSGLLSVTATIGLDI